MSGTVMFSGVWPNGQAGFFFATEARKGRFWGPFSGDIVEKPPNQQHGLVELHLIFNML